MSRIDQALARLRDGERLQPPPTALVSEGASPEFAAEPDASDSDAASGATENDESEQPSTGTPHRRDFDKLISNSEHATATEQYRRLAARLYLAQAEQGTRVAMVTSAMPGEGKTLTATNLALTLALSYKRRVLLLDADLRKPSIHTLLDVPNKRGLNDGVHDPSGPVPLLRLTDHLSVLTAGRADHDPMGVLSSSRMKRVLAEARAGFDWVIVDTPPVALLTDAHLLSSLVDTVVLVIQAGATQLPAINTAVNAIGRDRIFGVVLNRADDADENYAYDKYYYARPMNDGAGRA